VKLPAFDLPKPKSWDLITAAALGVGLALQGANIAVASPGQPGSSISGGLTFVFVLLQLGLTVGGLLLLGKTAKEGTLWGNLAAVACCLAGMSGFLLAIALWAGA
jgi:hypothetical protein